MIKEGRAWVYAIFAVVTLSSALGNLSQTGLNAMMVTVCNDFGTSPAVGQMLTSGYMLILGAVVPLSSFLMGRFTSKGLTLFATGLFMAGSLLSAVAPTLFVVLAGRILQAVAAGILIPLMQTIAMSKFSPNRRATAMGVAGIAMGFAPNIGPTIGGAMVAAWGWRSFFVMLALLAGAIFLFCAVLVANKDDKGMRTGLDIWSFIACTLSFGLMVLGASQASSLGFGNPVVLTQLFAGLLFLAAFVARQKRVDNPLIDLDIFSNRPYVHGFVALCFLFTSFMGITLIVPLYVEGVLGGTPLDAGLILLPGTIAALVFNPLSGILTDRIGVRPVTLIFGACLLAGSAVMVLCNAATPFWLVCAMQSVRSIGVSGLIGPLTSWSLHQLRGKQIADGSAFGLTVRQACASLGVAFMVLFASGMPSLSAEVAMQAAFAVSALFAVATFVTIVLRVK